MTENEIEEFKKKPLASFEEITENMLLRTTHTNTNINFRKVWNILQSFHKAIKHLFKAIDLNLLTENIQKNIEKKKSQLTIPFDDIRLNTSIFVKEINSINKDRRYKVTKNTNNSIIIQGEGFDFDTTRLIIQVRDYSGTVVYPLLKTETNQLTVGFSIERPQTITIIWI